MIIGSESTISSFKHIKGLTSLRFFLALWVVLFHNCEEFSDTGYYFEFIKNGYTAVSGFFLLSGFILAYTYNKKYKLMIYFRNRFSRIYPLYFFSLLFAFPLFFYYQYKTNPDYLNIILEVSLTSILMIQSWNFSWLLHLNPPTWSLSVELLLYILFPFFLYLLQKRSSTVLMAFLLIIYTSLIIYFGYFFGEITNQNEPKPFMHVPTFVLGIISGILFSKNVTGFLNFKKPIQSILIFIIVILCFMSFVLFFPYYRDILSLGLLAPFYICIFLLLANNTNLLSAKILVRLGEISYAFYLLHQPLKAYLYLFFKQINLNHILLQFGLYLVLLSLMSYYIYQYIELPLHKKFKYNFSSK